MPRLQVNGKASFSLSSTLIYVTSSHVKISKHWNNAIGYAIGAFDVAAFCSYIVDRKSDSSRRLGYFSTGLQGIVDAIDAIILHGEKEAGGELWFWSARVKKSWGGVCKPLFGEQIVGLNSCIQILAVNAYCHSHEHVLWTLYYLAIQTDEVAFFQSFVPKIVVAKVTLVIDRLIEFCSVLLNNSIYLSVQ